MKHLSNSGEDVRRIPTLSSRLGNPFAAVNEFQLLLKRRLIANGTSSRSLRSRLPDPMDAAVEFRERMTSGLRRKPADDG